MSIRTLPSAAFLLVLCLPLRGTAQDIWFVDDDNCPGPGSGTAKNPYCKIQDAIDAASDGDKIVVFVGTYAENISFQGKAITVQSIDPHNAEIVQATIIDGSDASQETTEGSAVTFSNSEGNQSILDGLSLTGGIGFNPIFLRRHGGGIYCAGSSPLIRNCRIFENHVTHEGGGLFLASGSPVIQDCLILGNSAARGGGIRVDGGTAEIVGCMIISNLASVASASVASGGGISLVDGSATIHRCVITNNVATGATSNARGGGISCGLGNPIITHSIISGNTADRGGGIDILSSDPVVNNCVISGNIASERGGGLFSTGTPAAVIPSNPVITNCTVVNNSAGESAGGIYTHYFAPAHTMILNSVLWFNDAPTGAQLHVAGQNIVTTVAYTDVQGGLNDILVDPGTYLDWQLGNLSIDPLFVEPDNEDYHLHGGSPCIDAADNTAVPKGVVMDLDGNPRFVDDPNTDDTGFGKPPIVDMGAYEFQFQDPCADDDGDGRVTICHIPPGNPARARTITVGASAVLAHLEHGDYCGPCEERVSQRDERSRQTPR